MEVLPLSKGKRQNKIVLGDADGVVQALGMRKGEETRSSVFKTGRGPDPITCLTLGAAKGQEDKIFVASGTTVRGVNKKGKEFFKFSSNLTEPIRHVHVDHTNIWATGEYVSNHYVDCVDSHFFASNDKIAHAALAPVVLEGEKNPILACRDRFVRVVQGSELYYEVAVAGAASVVHVCEKNDARRRAARVDVSEATDDRARLSRMDRTSATRSVPDAERASRREVLFGTEQGSAGQLFLDGERVTRGWTLDGAGSGRTRAGRGGISAVHAECDLTGDGLNDVVIGRDDGSIEIYGVDELGSPTLVGEINVGEAVQTLRSGRVATPFPEILAHTYSGKVVSFKPGADSATMDGFALGERLDDAQIASRRFTEQRRAMTLRREIERLEVEVAEARAKYGARSAHLIAADGPTQILHGFRLDPVTATHRLTLEAPSAISSIAVYADVSVDLLDEYGGGGAGTETGASSAAAAPTNDGSDERPDATASVVSRTPLDVARRAGGESASALAVYRLPSENQNRFEIEMRCQEGWAGKVRACVLPRRSPKTCVEVVRDVKPLCLHRRRHDAERVEEGNPSRDGDGASANPLGGTRALNILTVTGSFALEDAHHWTRDLLDEVPSKLPAAADADFAKHHYAFSYDFENVLLGTRLRVSGREGELRLWCDGVTPLALTKAFIGKSAAKLNVVARFDFEGDAETVAKFGALAHPLVLECLRLVKRATLLEGLKELKMQEPEISSFLSEEYGSVLRNEKTVAREAAARRGRLDFLRGVVKDFFVDWHKFKGDNVKHQMHEIDRVFQEYSFKALVDVLERRQ